MTTILLSFWVCLLYAPTECEVVDHEYTTEWQAASFCEVNANYIAYRWSKQYSRLFVDFERGIVCEWLDGKNEGLITFWNLPE